MILQGNLALEFGTITKCLVYNYTRVHKQIYKCSEYIASSQHTKC